MGTGDDRRSLLVTRARFAQALIAAAALVLAPALASASVLAPPKAEAEATVSPIIAADRETGSDDRIAERIRGIYSELPSLAGVRVEVNEGVVSLSGIVASSEDRQRAEAIAARVSGVVTIENAVERDTSVGGSVAGIRRVSQELAGLTATLPLIGAALLVWLVIGGFGYLIAGLGRLWQRLAPNSFLADLIASAIRFAFIVGGLVVALNLLGAGALMGAVLGGAGVVGIALGFAMRDTIENYVASLMLSLRQPFRANDHVVIDSHEGRVIRLTSRATVLMTLDGNHLRIPNGTVFRAVILNYTRNPQRRFDFVLGIDAADDPTAARQLGVEVLKALDFVLDNPEPQARVEEVGDSNIVIRYLAWIDQRATDFYKARSGAIPEVKRALEEAGFALPEPIYRLRFDAGAVAPALAAAERAEPHAPPARRPLTEPLPSDTAPADEVARMVDAERAETSEEKDLLDTRRPVE